MKLIEVHLFLIFNRSKATKVIVIDIVIIPINVPDICIIGPKLLSKKMGNPIPAQQIKGDNFTHFEIAINLPNINCVIPIIKKIGQEKTTMAKNCIPQCSYQGNFSLINDVYIVKDQSAVRMKNKLRIT